LLYPNLKIIFSYQKNKILKAPENFQELATKMGTSVKTIKIIESKMTNASLPIQHCYLCWLRT
jgi:hypothetical protein